MRGCRNADQGRKEDAGRHVHTPLSFLLLALQVNDEHGLCEGDECDGEASEDPGAKLKGILGLLKGVTIKCIKPHFMPKFKQCLLLKNWVPGVDGFEVGGAGGVFEDVVAHGHDA